VGLLLQDSVDSLTEMLRLGRRRYGEKMPRHCLTLDLKDDQTAISEYKRYHVKIWPEVKQSLFDAGVVEMEIYLLGTRMFMIMDVNDTFSLSAKAAADAVNAKVQEWETIMHGFQKQLPNAKPEQWWMVMDRVFNLADQ
jgi:L-rhamnose mutarotase